MVLKEESVAREFDKRKGMFSLWELGWSIVGSDRRKTECHLAHLQEQ